MSRRPDDLTPEEREARIAELRARRKARLRTLAWRSGMVTAGFAVLALVAVYWLLQTVAGRDVLLAQVVARLPAGSSFTWESIEGPLAGPLTLNGVEFHYDQIHFTAERVYLDPDIRPLLGKRLRLDALQLRNATLDLPKSDEPFKLPTWPDVLPQIELPLAIQADDLQVDGFRLSQQGQPLIDITQARGGIDIGDGYAKVEKLRLESDLGRFTANGEYRPARGYRTDLVATAVFPAPRGRTPARLGLVAKGNASNMVLAIAGTAPAPVRITASVKGRRSPDWQFRGNTEALDLGLFGVAGDNAPLAFDLQADGHQGTAKLQGRIEQGELVAEIEPSQVSIDDNKLLTVEPLALRLLDGRAVLRGTADFADETDPKFNFAINARQLQWGGDPANNNAGRIIGDADLGVAGRLKAWAAIGKASLQRDEQEAAVDFDARGDDARATLHKLAVAMPGGKLDVTGDVGWAPKLDWNVNGTLDGFDPGYFLPDWSGNLSGRFASTGAARDATKDTPAPGFDATVDVPRLRGHLRARALDASGKFALHGDAGEGEIALQLGGSKVDAKGKVGTALAIDGQLQPLHLADLLPDAGGSLAGTLKISGTRDAPNIEANLDGNGLKWQDYTAERLSLHGRLPWRGDGGELAINGSGIVAGLALDSVRVDARGAVENLRLDADARNPMIALALSGSANKRGANWQGTLDNLQLTPSKGDAWRLQQASQYSQNGAAFTLSPACLAASGGHGTLCMQANWPRTGITAKADALPLTLVQPWLPKSSGRDIGLNGNVSLDAGFKPRGNAWEGELHLASMDGGVRIGGARREVISYDHFSFDASFDPQAIKGRLGTGFKGDGYVDATFATGWDDFSPMQGNLYFHNSRLFWLELFSPDLVQPKGVLAGHISLAGTRGKPLLNGEAKLTEFTGELPALGIALTDGEAALTALADGSAKISGRFGSQSSTGGEATKNGYLQVDGSLSWLDGDAPLVFNVRGDDFLIADTTELRIVAAPDLQVEIGGGTIHVGGKVVVPAASIDIEKLDSGVSASEDVVVLDPVDPERAPSSRLDLGLAVTLGDAVKLKGYGLDGALSGTLNVRSRPGQSMAGTGQLDVEGRYAAYGQKLQITEGRLSWSNSPIGDPNISLRAEREVISADVTAGISVTGRATAPRARVWSDPELPESEALAYLVLGRSLNTASSSESQQINAANSALSAGAGLLASQLGAKIGLDDAGVLESRTLGGSVFGIGKYLSPKLYVSYGVSMVGEGSAVTLKYLMRKGFDAEIESSTIETRGSLNWRREK
ncbi:MAG: translocation/assembly module TamB domain-containing protein [Pseudoxanthomonas sp.]